MSDERPRPPTELTTEDVEDALVDGDRPITDGTARAALRQPVFRTIFLGAFCSNVGSWMQTVVLGAFAWSISHSSAFVGLVAFGQMGPSLLLAPVGGLIADVVDRKLLLVVISLEQLAFSVVLAVLCRDAHPSHLAIFLCVLAIGAGQAIFAPTYSAMLPGLVGRENLPGAISLNSAQMNASRVIGPAIGGVAYHAIGASFVFVANAVTYLFVVGALLLVHLPKAVAAAHPVSRIRQLTAGVAVARRDRIVGRSLVTIFLFSLVCLPFIGLMPVLAAKNLNLDPRSAGYGILYACFGTGALVGALSIGTILARAPRYAVVRIGLVGFAVMLAVFSLLRSPDPAYAVIAVVGAFYFAMVTSLSTEMQTRLDDHMRGRVMALWIMGFGGTVALGNLIGGPLAGVIGMTPLLLLGSAMALGLAFYADVRPAEGRADLAVRGPEPKPEPA